MGFPLNMDWMGGVGKGRSRGRQVLHIAMVPIIDIGWIAGFNQSNLICICSTRMIDDTSAKLIQSVTFASRSAT